MFGDLATQHFETSISALGGAQNCSEFVFTPMSPAREVNKSFKEKQGQDRGSAMMSMLPVLPSSPMSIHAIIGHWANCRHRNMCNVHFKCQPAQNTEASKNTRELNMVGLSLISHQL